MNTEVNGVMLEVMPLDPEVMLEVMPPEVMPPEVMPPEVMSPEVMSPEKALKVLMIVISTSNWLNICNSLLKWKATLMIASRTLLNGLTPRSMHACAAPHGSFANQVTKFGTEQ